MQDVTRARMFAHAVQVGRRWRVIVGAAAAVGLLAAAVAVMNPHVVKAEEYPPFSSLDDDDPVLPNGITPAHVMAWLQAGHTVSLSTTTTDYPNRVVQFRNPTTQDLEWRIGTIPAGTQYYTVMSNMGFKLEEHVQTCGNAKRFVDLP